MAANTSIWLGFAVVLLFITTPVAAFGAGDIVDVANVSKQPPQHGLSDVYRSMVLTIAMEISKILCYSWL
jgi:hypothetical protein